jgi:RNA polymerase sigma factor (sigma-70 family)
MRVDEERSIVTEGSSGVAEVPRMVAEPAAADDRRLVAAVRDGDDRAFEALYHRYHRRITVYVVGMVKDHGRAEDITQEVFVSALRRMRETERPIAFKPWIYEIAKNACIDQYRRSRRAEEVSYDADDGLAPGDYGRLVGSDPTPDAAVAAKQDLDHLCGAFGGLSDTHHEILVLRELEGLSYREIGERMGMSRPAVESTLFRARRRLTEEYDELVSGARCARIQGLIAVAAGSALGSRDTRRLARHVSHCQPCRREALAAGLDSEVLTHVPLRRRAAAKLAGLLPIPWLARFGRGRGPTEETAASIAGPGWGAQLPLVSEQLGGGLGKLATLAAVAVAGIGAAGVGTQVGRDEPRRDRAAQEAAAARAGERDRAPARATKRSGERENGERSHARDRSSRTRGDEGKNRRETSGGGTVDRAAGGGVTTTPAAEPGATGGAPAGDAARRGGGEPGGSAPRAAAPAAGNPVQKTVEDTVQGAGDTVDKTVQGAGDTVEETVQGAGDTVDGAVQGAGETVGGAVDGAGSTVGGSVGGAGSTVGGAVGGAGNTLGQATQPVHDTVNGVTEGLLPPP